MVQCPAFRAGARILLKGLFAWPRIPDHLGDQHDLLRAL